MKKRFLLLTILLLSIIMTLSVNVTTVEAKAKTKLSTTSVETSVCKKKTIKLKNYTRLSKKKIKKVKWTTSNKRVVSIKASGKYKQNCKIIAKKAGKATIKVKYNGKTYKCKVVVNHGREAVYATRMVDDTSKPIYEEVDNGHYETYLRTSRMERYT